jgi:hypothetical protein
MGLHVQTKGMGLLSSQHHFHSLYLHRVEAGKNTSTVIPASRKRRQKGNPVVSDKTVMYGF